MALFTRFLAGLLIGGLAAATAAEPPALRINDRDYFAMPGVNVMAFQDIYPEGHQGGVNIIQHGVRVASDGDLRLDATPGQWQPIPKQIDRVVNRAGNEIVTTLAYPDESRNRKGFNPIDYPDLKFTYKVRVVGVGASIHVFVDLDAPLPQAFVGKVGFNLELFPASLFGHAWYLDQRQGLFPRQGNGPDTRDASGESQAVPLATGRRLTVAPETDTQRMTIESRTGELALIDARNKHNNAHRQRRDARGDRMGDHAQRDSELEVRAGGPRLAGRLPSAPEEDRHHRARSGRRRHADRARPPHRRERRL
jgi:hypothetical protein